MVAGDAETDFAVDFEAAGRRKEAEGGRSEWVCGWEGDAAVVESLGVGGWGGGSGESEVPVVEVCVAYWGGCEVWAWVFVEVGAFF